MKLAVGIDDLEALSVRQRQLRRHGGRPNPFHITRMMPRRASEILSGGSLYWVIKGHFACRQGLVGIERVTLDDGRAACRRDLDPTLIPVRALARRPFQGWRYLAGEDAPKDVSSDDQGARLPAELRVSLSDLGLL